MKRTYRVVGDVLHAFSVEVELEQSASAGELADLVAAELGLSRYGRDDDIRIDDVEEINENGESVPDSQKHVNDEWIS